MMHFCSQRMQVAGQAETDVHVSCVWLIVIQVHAEGHARFGCCIWQVGSCSMLNTDVCVCCDMCGLSVVQ